MLYQIAAVGLSASSSPMVGGLYNPLTGVTLYGYYRSYSLIRILRTTGAIVFMNNYDIFGNSGSATSLANDLAATSSSYIIIVYSWDEPQNNRLSSPLPAQMYLCGATPAIYGGGSMYFAYRSAYILVGICGGGTGSGLEYYSGASDSSSTSWLIQTIQIYNQTFYASSSANSTKTIKTQCLPCPMFSSRTKSSSSFCKCIPGYYMITTVNPNVCSPCPQGTYSYLPGATISCFVCIGYKSNTTGASVCSNPILTPFPVAYSGQLQTYKVPRNVSYLLVKLWGAGGSGGQENGAPFNYGGGAGGFTQCYIPVVPNSILQLVVGGGGMSGARGSTTIGGFGGGGNGYANNGNGDWLNGAGGGRTAIQGLTNLTYNDLATAGGGGGGGSCSNFVNMFLGGGAGGGSVGLASPSSGFGGGGGTQSGGGVGLPGYYGNGVAGSKYQGGATAASGGGRYGAGGGGGLWGGGSGSGANIPGYALMAGGGGGSGSVVGCFSLALAFSVAGSSGTTTGQAPSFTYSGNSAAYQNGVGVGGLPGQPSSLGNGGNGLMILQAISQGSSVVSNCLAGQYYSFTNISCVLCAFGSYSSASSTSCTPCPLGYNTSSIGSVSIAACSNPILTPFPVAYSGQLQTYKVPRNVSYLLVKLWGAGGGGGTSALSQSFNYGGGAGGFTQCYIPVTPNLLIKIFVGGGGQTSLRYLRILLFLDVSSLLHVLLTHTLSFFSSYSYSFLT